MVPLFYQDDPPEERGHVADGGYFDNAGAHTLVDVLRGFGQWLDSESGAAPELRDWAKYNLEPQLIVLHNGRGKACEIPPGWHQPNDDLVKCKVVKDDWVPRRPLAEGPLELYANVLGPLVTAVNVTGLGANRRRAEIARRHHSLERGSELGGGREAGIG
jgi:hypothetical protein